MCLYPVTIINKSKQNILSQLFEAGFEPSDNVLAMPDTITVPCGRCVECQRSMALDWAYRCAIESSHYSENCMITLTYANTDGNLNKRDVQLFFKRLRRDGVKCRYFGCGEYGSKCGRPHYHFVIFGWIPPDLRYFYTDKKGIDIYLSEYLAKVWKNGYVSVTKGFDTKSAIYASLYMQKFNDFTKKLGVDKSFVKPFRMMSRMPGIGGNSLDKCDWNTDKIYYNGSFRRIPRYLLERYLNKFPFCDIVYCRIKDRRKSNSDIILRCTSPESLTLREISAKNFLHKFRKKS